MEVWFNRGKKNPRNNKEYNKRKKKKKNFVNFKNKNLCYKNMFRKLEVLKKMPRRRF